MKESIGSTASLNIVFAFIAIVFAFVAGALSYYKAFKINNVITSSIEKYEGFNSLAVDQINLQLSGLGYQRLNVNCPDVRRFGDKEFELDLNPNNGDGYCIYHYSSQTDNPDDYYDEYGVTTYMSINFPILNRLIRIPVNTTTHEIYRCYGGVCDK